MRRARKAIVYYIYLAIYLLLGRLPLRPACGVMEFLAMIAYWGIPAQRKGALRHLATACPNIPEKRRRAIVRGMYRNLARNAAEFIHLTRIIKSGRLGEFVEISGLEHAEAVRKSGSGCLALTAHLGNWELLAARMVHEGYKVSVVARKSSDERNEELLDRLRKQAGVDAVDRDNARELLRRLKNGHFLGILSDHDIPKLDGVFVDFFGKPAYTPTGVVLMAMRTGCPMLPMFIHRRPGGGHVIEIHPPMDIVNSGNRTQDVLVNTRKYTGIIESQVRAHPEEWMWFHNRWKTRPGPERKETGDGEAKP